MAGFGSGDTSKQRRLKAERAIKLAMESKWDEAVRLNQEILETSQTDVDAYNRLGKALTELGRFGEARQSYGKALELDPMNRIAERNLVRLSTINETEAAGVHRRQIDPRLLIEETGKTGYATLVRPGAKEALATVAAGEQVNLVIEGRSLTVQSLTGLYLGKVDQKLSQRLIALMNGGNRYAAAVTAHGDNSITIIIREIERHPSQNNRASFPFKPGDAPVIRAYIKGSLLHQYDLDDDDEDREVDDEEDDEMIHEEGEEPPSSDLELEPDETTV